MADDAVLRSRVGAVTVSDDLDALALASRHGSFTELGATGLKRSAGYLDEEFLPALKGRKGVEVYREMSQNDPIVSALLFAIDRLVRNVDWRVDPAGKDKQSADAAKLVETCMEDMSHTWDDFITEVLSCLVYGWSVHEVVYKRRGGPWSSDQRMMSKFSDGLVGWRKMPIRAQETLQRWVFDESGECQAMVQIAPPRYSTTVIPMNRTLLFRYRQSKESPEGVSMLRGAYRPYYFLKRLQEFEAIGVERDLAGLPIAKVPAEMLRAKPGTDAAKSVDAFKKLVKSVRRNDQEGMVFPMAYDQDTKQPLYSFELLGGGGTRAFNTDAIIRRYEERILMSVLADFIMVGHQSTGSYSLHTDKTGIFRTALNSICQMIADVLNRSAVPKLFLANGWKPAELPTIVPSDVDAPDISVLASFMQSMQSMGVPWFPDGDLENFVRQAARLPELGEDQLEERRQLQMRSQATAFAQANANYVQAVMSGQQAMMPDEGRPGVGGEAGD